MNFMTSNMELTEIDLYYSGKCYKGLLYKVIIQYILCNYRMDVLRTWKMKCSPEATYDCLLDIFVKGRFTDCATEMVTI